MGEITGNASAVSIKTNLFQCFQEKPKSKRKWGKKKFPHVSLSEGSRCFKIHQTRSALQQTVGQRGWLPLSSPALLPGVASAIMAFPCICLIVMQIFGAGSWFCSLAHLLWGREPCGWQTVCAAQAFCNLPTGQWPELLQGASSWLQHFGMHLSV